MEAWTRVSFALITVTLLSPTVGWAQVRGQEPVALSIEGCPDVNESEVRRVLMVELGVQVVSDSGDARDHSRRARVQCPSRNIRVVVEEPAVGLAFVQFVDLEREAPDARMRVLGLRIAETMAAGSSDREPRDDGILVTPTSSSGDPGGVHPPLVAGVRHQSSPHEESNSMCVRREVFEAVLQCPIGASPVERDARPRVKAGRSASREQGGRPSKTTPGLSEAVIRDESEKRAPSKQGREWSLAKQLELVEMGRRLVENTDLLEQDWPRRVLNLAGSYDELSAVYQAKARELDELIASAHRAGQASTVRSLEKAQKTLEREEVRARDGAIEQYKRWAKRVPDAQNRDEVLAVLGSLYEEQAEYYARRSSASESPVLPERRQEYLQRAKLVFEDLVKNHPGSRFTPFAYLHFAKTASERGEMDEALSHYKRLVQSKHPWISPWAMYRSAWCHIALDQDTEAVSAFVNAIRYSEANPSSKTAASIARNARQELVGPFSRAYPPRQAWRFFKRVGRGGGSLEMMERLAQRYFDQGQWAEADEAYRALMANAGNDDRRCRYQAQAARAGLRTLSRSDQAAVLHRTLDMMSAFTSEVHPARDERQCRDAVASLVLDEATSWHHETVGPSESEGTGDEQTMELASELYRRALEELPNLDELELDGWDEEGRPTVYRVSYWYADLLYARGLWAECGPAFDRVVALDTSSGAELLEEAAYSAVLCYDRLYTSSERQGESLHLVSTESDDGALPSLESLRPRDLTSTERDMLRAYNRYLCFVSESDDLTRIGYRRARVHLEANHFEEAAILFREVAFSAPGDELGQQAALHYVNALNIVGRLEPERFRACRGDMERAVDRFLGDSRMVENERVATELTKTRCSIIWSHAEEHAERDQFGACADLYLEIYDRYSASCQQISGHGLDEVLHNAAVCLEADASVDRSLEVRQTLIDDFGEGSRYAREHGGKGSPLAARAIYHMGRSLQDIAYFTKAAERYETFSSRYPGEEEARDALQNATLFRMKLGQPDQALADARLFEKNYGRHHKAETATVLLAVGTVFLDRQQWRQASEHYRGFLKRYARESSPDIAIRGHVNAGYALWHQNGRGRRGALSHFEQALKIADRGSPDRDETLDERFSRYRAMLDGDDEPGDEVSKARLVRMADAVAKARFYRAEGQYEQFSSITMPPFRPKKTLPNLVRRWWIETQGRETVRTVERAFKSMNLEDRFEWFHIVQTEYWASTELTRWLDRRREAQVDVMELYRQAAAEDVPAWEIAAAKRVGDMYRSTLQALDEAPIPEDFEARRGELVQQYREHAVGAYVQCLRESTRNRWFNDWSRSCEQELNALMPRDYPIADEIRSVPIHAYNPMAEPDIVRHLHDE